MYRLTRFGAMVVMDPGTAAEQLVGEFNIAAGSTQVVAANMGVHSSTVKRWVCKLSSRRPSIRHEIQQMRDNAKAIH